jgi:hypothetical protein
MRISKQDVRISCLLKGIVIIAAAVGVLKSVFSGNDTFMGGSHVFMFFTIQSNIAIALICAVGLYKLLNGKPVSNRWYLLKYVGTVSITLTGMVFCFVLAPTLGKYAWGLANVLTHVVAPIAAIIDFFVTGRYGTIAKKDVWYVTLPPLAYAVYAGIGYIAGWEFLEGINYPYFFLNWGSPAGAFGFTSGLPFMGVVWWILALLLFLVLVGYLYLIILDQLKRTKS